MVDAANRYFAQPSPDTKRALDSALRDLDNAADRVLDAERDFRDDEDRRKREVYQTEKRSPNSTSIISFG